MIPGSGPENAEFTSVVISDVDAAVDWFVGCVADLSAADLERPSALPGWSRAHVVAHVVLNAEGFIEVAAALRDGRPAHMYPGGASARDAEIEDMARQSGTVLLDRLSDANTRFRRSWNPRPPRREAATAAGHPWFDSSTVLLRRLCEIQLHGVDLAVQKASVDSWSDTFVAADLPMQWLTVPQRTGKPVWVVDDIGREWATIAPVQGGSPLVVTRRQLLGWVLDRVEIVGLPQLAPWSNRSRWEHLDSESDR